MCFALKNAATLLPLKSQESWSSHSKQAARRVLLLSQPWELKSNIKANKMKVRIWGNLFFQLEDLRSFEKKWIAFAESLPKMTDKKLGAHTVAVCDIYKLYFSLPMTKSHAQTGTHTHMHMHACAHSLSYLHACTPLEKEHWAFISVSHGCKEF